MNKEQQIKELKDIVCNNAGAYICMGAMYKGENYNAKEEEINLKVATALYDAGYRKQSDTVREFAEKLKGKLTDPSGWVLYKGQDLCYDIDKIAAEFGVEDELCAM